jgi:hypothetical protein
MHHMLCVRLLCVHLTAAILKIAEGSKVISKGEIEYCIYEAARIYGFIGSMTCGDQQDISMTEIGKTRKADSTLETTAL